MNTTHNISSHLQSSTVVDIESTERSFCLGNEFDIATGVLSVDDDPSLNPWTLRAFVIGIILSAFGSVLGEHPSSVTLILCVKHMFAVAEIYAFKPVCHC